MSIVHLIYFFNFISQDLLFKGAFKIETKQK